MGHSASSYYECYKFAFVSCACTWPVVDNRHVYYRHVLLKFSLALPLLLLAQTPLFLAALPQLG